MKQQQHSRKTVWIIIGSLVAIGTVLCILLAGFTEGQTSGDTMQQTASGLKYQILTQAPAGAEKPKAGQTAIVHYTGWLDDNGEPGQKFDSSKDRMQPFSFKVGKHQVIAGWDEAVADMKVGEKRRVIIPPALGYGARGAGRVIPPNATLLFDIELLQVSK